MRRAAGLICILAAGLAVAACGDDEPASEARTETGPTVTERSTTTPQPDPQRTVTTPAAPPDTPTKTTPAAEPQGGGAVAPTPPAPGETEGRDDAPPAGSPAERFEKYCDEHPGACG